MWLLQYDDGTMPPHYGHATTAMEVPTSSSIYDPHAHHRPTGASSQPPGPLSHTAGGHHSPHMNHSAGSTTAMHHQYHHANHVSPNAMPNNVMGALPEAVKRDKDAIYGSVLFLLIFNTGHKQCPVKRYSCCSCYSSRLTLHVVGLPRHLCTCYSGLIINTHRRVLYTR